MDNNQRAVLIGLENPDGTLNGALNIIETTSGLSVTPNGDVKERNLVRSSLSNVGAIIGAKNYDLTLPVELKGGGIENGVVQAPEISAALLASGMTLDAAAMITISAASGEFIIGESITNSTDNNAIGSVAHIVNNANNTTTLWVFDVQNMPAATDAILGDTSAKTATINSVDDALCYRLTSSRAEHATCQVHTFLDKTRRIARKCRGTFQFDWAAGETAKLQITLKGLYETPADASLPDADYDDAMPPFGENAGLTIAGYPNTGTLEKLSFQLANEIVPVPDINSPHGRHSFRIKARKPTGSIDPEVVELADFNPFTLWENGSKSAIHATLGKTPGEYVSAVVTSAQFTGVKDKERAGLDVYDLSYSATGKNDNEFYLFFH